MAESFQKPAGNGNGAGSSPIRPRTLAILIMIAGLFAFVLTRVVFGDQALCLLGSSLITFAGLFLIITGRNKGYGRQMPRPAEKAESQQTFQSRRVPSGLRAAIRRSAATPPAPIHRTPVHVEPEAAEEPPIDEASLLGQVIDRLQSQGAQVTVETLHDDRGILQVQAADGRQYVTLVREDAEPVDLADVRALAALVNIGHKAGGYLIAGGPFTQRADEWAEARGISLITADALDELSI